MKSLTLDNGLRVVYASNPTNTVYLGLALDAGTRDDTDEESGVQKSQISRLENGKSITISSLMRLFSAMEIPVTLDMGGIGKVVLCQ